MFTMAEEIITALQEALGNPWMLLFLGTWVLGFMIKEYTKLNSDLIPWVLFIWGAGLGYVLIQASVGGIIVGAVLGAVQIALYDAFKPLVSRLTGGEVK